MDREEALSYLLKALTVSTGDGGGRLRGQFHEMSSLVKGDGHCKKKN